MTRTTLLAAKKAAKKKGVKRAATKKGAKKKAAKKHGYYVPDRRPPGRKK